MCRFIARDATICLHPQQNDSLLAAECLRLFCKSSMAASTSGAVRTCRVDSESLKVIVTHNGPSEAMRKLAAEVIALISALKFM